MALDRGKRLLIITSMPNPERAGYPKQLPMPFFACLGNHDYDGNNLNIESDYVRQNPASRFKLPDRWYRVDLPAEKPVVTVLMLDSNMELLGEVRWNQQIAWLQK